MARKRQLPTPVLVLVIFNAWTPCLIPWPGGGVGQAWQELGALAFGQVPENDLGVIWILDVDRLTGHDPSLRPTPDAEPARLSGTRE